MARGPVRQLRERGEDGLAVRARQAREVLLEARVGVPFERRHAQTAAAEVMKRFPLAPTAQNSRLLRRSARSLRAVSSCHFR